ncbi:MAG: hypothetical protein ABF868_02640 [Sporolactobacillus sp.]
MINDNQEKYALTKEVLDQLNLSYSKLRRMATALEKAGYNFMRSKNNQRLFKLEDIKLLQLMLGKTASGLSYKAAADVLTGQQVQQLLGSDAQVAAAERPQVEIVQKMDKPDSETDRKMIQRDQEVIMRFRQASENNQQHKKKWLAKVLSRLR